MSDDETPAAYRALLAATAGVVREVVKLHGPVRSGLGTYRECRGCEATGYEWDYPDWPCQTSELIAGRYGVSLASKSYVVDGEARVGPADATEPRRMTTS